MFTRYVYNNIKERN